jgi:adenine phosphoribosyltransferase
MIMDLKALIRDIPDFPQPGIIFRDITTLLRNPQGLKYVIDDLAVQTQKLDILPDYIIGIESRGFIFAPALAYHLDAGFVPVRKKGKLPALVHSIEYDLEYGTDILEIHQDALTPDAKVMIVDDVIATGGTAKATADLLTRIGCNIVAYGFIVELEGLEGRKQLPDVPMISLVKYS